MSEADNPAGRAQLVDKLLWALRGLSAQSVLFNQALAELVAINATDLRCLDILGRTGPITAGQLAELTGLTTGAITGVLDRLEEAGFLRRMRDPDDRRRVIIQACGERTEREVGPLFEPLAQAMSRLAGRYSDHDLSLIIDFVERMIPLMQRETARLRREPGP